MVGGRYIELVGVGGLLRLAGMTDSGSIGTPTPGRRIQPSRNKEEQKTSSRLLLGAIITRPPTSFVHPW